MGSGIFKGILMAEGLTLRPRIEPGPVEADTYVETGYSSGRVPRPATYTFPERIFKIEFS